VSQVTIDAAGDKRRRLAYKTGHAAFIPETRIV
jgi:hypothetical protein